MSEVLCCIDFSSASEAVAVQAARLAHSDTGRLHLIHVAAPEPVLVGYDDGPVAAHTRDDRAGELLQEHHAMREIANRLEADERFAGITIVPLLTMGATVAKVLEEAERINAGLIVVGSHGHGGLYNLLLGSVSEGLIKRSKRPIVVVPSKN